MDTQSLVKSFEKFPFSRLLFLTIRDPKQSGQWMSINKAQSYIKLYSDNYIIVMSPHGGTHFHLLAGIKPDRKPTGRKGVHFYFKYLTADRSTLNIPDVEELQARDYCKRERDRKRLDNIMSLRIPHECIHCANIIKAYWLKKTRAGARLLSKSKKQCKINSVLSYLEQNLYEDRDEDYVPALYNDYIQKISNCNRTSQPRGHPSPLGAGIDDIIISPTLLG